MSVSYEIWENYNKSIEASPFLKVWCQFSSQHTASALSGTPTKILQYQIEINSLLKTSIFQKSSFETWNGDVVIDELKVTTT